MNFNVTQASCWTARLSYLVYTASGMAQNRTAITKVNKYVVYWIWIALWVFPRLLSATGFPVAILFCARSTSAYAMSRYKARVLETRKYILIDTFWLIFFFSFFLSFFFFFCIECILLDNTFGNGTLTLRNDTKDGGIIYEFQCKPGFLLNGSSVISCLHGQWNGSKPSCHYTGE